jgi:hypothetical protein
MVLLGEVFTVENADSRLARMKRSVMTTGRYLQEQWSTEGKRVRAAMLTLTYAKDDDWEPGDIRALLNRVNVWAKRHGGKLSYVWVGELTKRGRMHYHVLLWLPKGLTLPKPDKQGWWQKGLTRIEWARSALGYLCKYASKGSATLGFPKGARISGWGGLVPALRQVRRWWMLPKWLRCYAPHTDDFRRAVGGGWVAFSSGEWLPSPYLLVGVGPKWVRVALAIPLPLPRLSPLR